MRESVLTRKRILIVDDDARNTFAMGSYLESRDMDVFTVENGFAALEILQLKGNQIDIVLMDIMMPGMDGYETMRRIRRQQALAGIPIIAVTAQAMKGDREKCLRAGATEYMAKPVNLKELLQKIEGLVQQPQKNIE